MQNKTELTFEDVTLINYLKDINSPFYENIRDVYNEIKELLNTRIPVIFPHYTLHNTGHSFRIMEYMSKLVQDFTKLTELEIALLVYSALLHDIGMALSDEDEKAIKNDTFEFCEVKFSTMMKQKGIDNNPTLALQEYVRRIHASLSARYIR